MNPANATRDRLDEAHERDNIRSAEKAFADLRAAFAFLGLPLWRSNPNDGAQRYFTVTPGGVALLPDLAAGEAMLERIRGRGKWSI